MTLRHNSVLLLAVLGCGAHAQYFQRLGNGLGGQQGWGMFSDSTGVYYLGGSGGEISGTVSPGVINWDGEGFNALACGVEWDCVSPLNPGGIGLSARTMARWNGELYLGGDFVSAAGVTLNHIARFDGTSWQPLGLGMNATVRGLKAYPDGLYAAGWFSYADTVNANGLARWDGTRWWPVHDIPRFMLPYDSTNFINDVAIYNGDVYVCGVFSGEGDLEELARFDGNAWVPVGQGIRGSLAKVLHLDVYDGLLYISGAFADSGPFGHPTNPASGIVGWDGNDWVHLGNATDGANYPWVTNTAWRNDTLYACGDYNRIGDVDAGGLAYWDGNRWCAMLPTPSTWAINSMAFYNDTLHVGGGFEVIGEDTLHNTGKWLLGNQAIACGSPDAVGEVPALHEGLSCWPNPANDALTVTWPQGTRVFRIEVISPDGRLLFNERLSTSGRRAYLDVQELPAGTYSLRVITPEGPVFQRFVKAD